MYDSQPEGLCKSRKEANPVMRLIDGAHTELILTGLRSSADVNAIMRVRKSEADETHKPNVARKWLHA